MYLYAVEQPVSFNHSVHACVISQLLDLTPITS